MMAIERFWANVLKKEMGYKTECWIWKAYRNKYGYACFRGDNSTSEDGYKGRLAHRWSYEQFVKKISDDLELDHLCKNRGCVNPEHLKEVTHKGNMQGVSYNLNITHCPQGHSYSGDNLYIRTRKDGRTYRMCRECKRNSEKKYYSNNLDKVRKKSLDYYHKNKQGE